MCIAKRNMSSRRRSFCSTLLFQRSMCLQSMSGARWASGDHTGTSTIIRCHSRGNIVREPSGDADPRMIHELRPACDQPGAWARDGVSSPARCHWQRTSAVGALRATASLVMRVSQMAASWAAAYPATSRGGTVRGAGLHDAHSASSSHARWQG